MSRTARTAHRLFRAYRRAGGCCGMRIWCAAEGGDGARPGRVKAVCISWCRVKGIPTLPF